MKKKINKNPRKNDNSKNYRIDQVHGIKGVGHSVLENPPNLFVSCKFLVGYKHDYIILKVF